MLAVRGFRIGFGAIAPLAFAASGCLDQTSVDKTILVDACVAESNTRASCTCMADAAHEMLDEPVFDAMVAGADGRTDEADDAYYAMTSQQQQSVAEFVRAMPGRCNMPPVEGVT